MNDVIKTIQLVENSGLLIDGFTETGVINLDLRAFF